MKTICVVTGTRAEYGLLKPVIKRIKEDPDLDLKLAVTGMHLTPEFGYTFKEIEEDGFVIDERIEIVLSSDTDVAVVKSVSLGMISFSEYFKRIRPDMIVILGDRYEIFATASVAAMMRIPIAHISGGDTTEGAVDEFIRHSITKMSYLHFTTTEEYKKRVEQLGEEPSRVFNVGSTGVENVRTLNLLSLQELENKINFKLDGKYALVTFHPVTLEDNTAIYQVSEMLSALDDYKDIKFIFTKSNSDAGGRMINKLIDDYVLLNCNCTAFYAMGVINYLSAMKYASIIIGNSSSGILEAPSFNVPTIDIGDRQKGRIKANSIISCKPIREDIKVAISYALTYEFLEKIKYTVNPYEKRNSSYEIVLRIKEYLYDKKIDLKKTFYNMKL